MPYMYSEMQNKLSKTRESPLESMGQIISSRCPGEEDFLRVFTIYGHNGHLGHVTQMPRTNFCSPYPRRLHLKFGFDRPSGF